MTFTKTNRTRLLSSCVAIAACSLFQGCAPMKTVMISSTPENAHLTIYKVTSGGEESPLPNYADVQAPVSAVLDFSNQARYRVEAHRMLCMPSLDTSIT